MNNSFLLDAEEIPFTPGQTIMQAATAAGKYIPHLCWHPDFTAHGSCKLCTVKIGGRFATACTTRAAAGQEVENQSEELTQKRRTLLQMLFVEGNHFCPACEKSGNCTLQATAYEMGMLGPHFDHFYPDRPVDASHPEVWLDFNRCIMCELCVRASREVDGKNVFAIGGRGAHTTLLVNSPSGQLHDSEVAVTDRAVHICPVGALMPKRQGFVIPIGQRPYDAADIAQRQEDS